MNEHALATALTSIEIDPAAAERVRCFDPQATYTSRRRAASLRIAAVGGTLALVVTLSLVVAAYFGTRTPDHPAAASSAPSVTLRIDDQEHLTSPVTIGGRTLAPTAAGYRPAITAQAAFQAAATATRPVRGPARLFLAQVTDTSTPKPHPVWVALQAGGPSEHDTAPASAGNVAAILQDTTKTYTGQVTACLVSTDDATVQATVTGQIST